MDLIPAVSQMIKEVTNQEPKAVMELQRNFLKLVPSWFWFFLTESYIQETVSKNSKFIPFSTFIFHPCLCNTHFRNFAFDKLTTRIFQIICDGMNRHEDDEGHSTGQSSPSSRLGARILPHNIVIYIGTFYCYWK